MTDNQRFGKDYDERNTRWIVFSRIAVVSYFLVMTIFIQFRTVRKIPEEYLWISYTLISAIYVYSAVCLILPRAGRHLRGSMAIQSVSDVIFVTGIVLVTGGIDSVYSVLYSLVIIYSALLMGRRGGFSIAALSGLCYVLVVNLDFSVIYDFLYDEGIVPRGGVTQSYILTRAVTHVASFALIALLASFVVEQERKTQRLLAEKATAFDRLDLLYRSIIESVDTGILTVNLEGHIRSFNRAAEEISGFTFGEVVNRRIEEIFPGVSAVLSPPGPEKKKRQRKRFEIGIRKKTGEAMILGFSESPLIERGVKIGSILIFQDLTSLKEMEREREKNKQFAFIGQMAAGLAHELRTPLQSISGSIQILRRDLKLEPMDERLMQVILRAKDQMESLVRNFLFMARSNLDRRSKTDIGKLVEDVIESLTCGADWNPRVELRKRIEHGLEVMGDPSEIRQIYWNLMINAVQSMPEGGTLSVSASRDGTDGETSTVRVEIDDTGSSIDPALLEKIWEPFYTTKERGCGLGLAIVRRIVESHGGAVEVQSDAARGTRFRVRLPAVLLEEPAAPCEFEHPSGRTAAAGAAR